MTDWPAHLSCLPIFQIIRHEDVPPWVSLLATVGVVVSVVVNLAAHRRQALSSSSLHFRRPRWASSSFLFQRRWFVVRRNGYGHWRIILRVRFRRFALILLSLLRVRLLRLWNYENVFKICSDRRRRQTQLHTLLLRRPRNTTAMELRRLPLLFESLFPPKSPRPSEFRRDALTGFCVTGMFT